MQSYTEKKYCIGLAMLFLLLVGALPTQAQTPVTSLPYFTDFESGVGAEWSTNAVDASQPYNFTAFSGRFGSATQTLSLANLTPGTSYTVRFDLYIIDSWDGGGDNFGVSVDGVSVFQESFANGVVQTNARRPDEGWFQMGFGTGATTTNQSDAIYRNLEVVFVATAATAQIGFRGVGLGALADESWGIDNVGVNLTSANQGPTSIRTTTLPPAGTTSSGAIDRILLSATRNLLASTATNALNYELREAGLNGVFGDGDDVINAVTPNFTAGKTVRLMLYNSPLQPGLYRFQAYSALRDFQNNAVAAFTREFTLANPALGRVENTDNGLLVGASILTPTETPVESGFLTALGIGTFLTTADVDYWGFSADAGDRFTFRLESELASVSQTLSLQTTAGSQLTTGSGASIAQIQNYTIATSGTYYVKATTALATPYRLRMDRVSGARQLESEVNDVQAKANSLLGFDYPLRAAGALVDGDSTGDVFNVGVLDVGDVIKGTLLLPSCSSLTATGVFLAVQSQGSVSNYGTLAGGLDYTVETNAVHYVRVFAPTGLELRAQYVLNISVLEHTKTIVTSVSLPDEGTTNASVIDRFTVGFSEDMSQTSVSNSANYDLRSAGPDTVFGNGDDVTYGLSVSYSNGLVASFMITNGPLQMGLHRLTVSTGVTDRAQGSLATAYVRRFTMAGVTNFVLESQSNGTVAEATSLSPEPDATADGSFLLLNTVAAGGGTNPYSVVVGYFNADTNLDLATANGASSNVSVWLGNGDGMFGAATNYAVGSSPYSVTTGDFNGDGKTDLAAANYGASTVSVLLGNGNGTFAAATNFAVGSNPRSVAVGDLNGDGKADLATANVGGNVSVLLGNGNGTFAAATNFAVGSTPYSVVARDVNGDGKQDLVTANYNSASVSVLVGNGNGTFAAITNYALGVYPNSLVIEDLNGDGMLDLATANSSGNNVSVLQNKGDGTFRAPANYTVGASPQGLAAGDVNNDGRLDLVVANTSGNTVSVLLGNQKEWLAESPAGSGMRSGQGQGNVTDSSDLDYWSFYGQAGDWMTLAVEVPTNVADGRLSYTLIHPNGTTGLVGLSLPLGGCGQMTPFTLPTSGRYTVKVSSSSAYQGEYRLRVTTVTPPTWFETEPNDYATSPNTLAFSVVTGGLKLAVAGYIGVADTFGDYFRLGNLSQQTVVQLNLSRPVNSGLIATMGIYTVTGTLVTNVPAGTTNLTWTVNSNAAYVAMVRAASGAGLLAQYKLDIAIADVLPPTVVSVSLPDEGTTTNMLMTSSFKVDFSEEMIASTVTNPANYDLRSAGDDGVLGNADDEVYGVTVSYASGLTATFTITGPSRLEGLYRFTIGAGLMDLAQNPMSAYVRQFTMAGVLGDMPEYMREGRKNDTADTATSLSVSLEDPTGGFSSAAALGVNTNPFDVVLGYFNADMNLDVATANYGSANMGVRLGNGDGTFGVETTYPMGASPSAIAAGDVNGDGKPDLATANYGANNASVRLGLGDGTFGAVSNYTMGSGPRALVLVDVNGDGNQDLLTANSGTANVSVRLGLGNGSFGGVTNFAVTYPYALAVGDVNGDGNPDLATANYSGNTVSVLLGNGNGAFATAVNYAVSTYPTAVTLGDLNRDGNPDLVTANYSSTNVSVLLGNGDGTFGAAVVYAAGNNPQAVVVADFNGDENPDLATANYGANTVCVLPGNGDGTFGGAVAYLTGYYPHGLAAGDVNNDGRLDLAVANYSGSTVSILLGGSRVEWLTESPVGSGMRSGQGRGRMMSTADVDNWSFFGQAGDWLTLAVENPGNPASSAVQYYVKGPGGNTLINLVSSSVGSGQSTPVTLPTGGRYTVQVGRYTGDYQGEYRLRVTTVTPPTRIETEANDSVGTANPLTYVESQGGQEAAVAGYIGVADGSGDYFQLGNLAEQTVVQMNLSRPVNSGLIATMGIYTVTGTLVTNVPAGTTNLTWTVNSNAAYMAMVRASSGTGLLAQYLLKIKQADVLPPRIVSVSLPAEGTTTNMIMPSFTVVFSEEMNVASVTNPANYDLRSAGDDGVLGNADDEVYGVNVVYSGGLISTHTITGTARLEGLYRYTIGTGLTDRAWNSVTGAYVRTFTIPGAVGQVAEYVREGRKNDSADTATSLSVSLEEPAGGFSYAETFGMVGNPKSVVLGYFNADTNLDLATANANTANMSVRLGNGNGTFGTETTYPMGANPYTIAVGDVNGDGKADLATANVGLANVSVRLGLGDGTFGAVTNYPMGISPLCLVLRDFNGDGRLDMATANAGSANVGVRLGLGNGSFGGVTNFPVTSPYSLAVGDVNGDGNPDLATVNHGANTVSVLLGNGNGTFGTAVNYAVPGSPIAVALGDLNGDGKSDLVTANDSSNTVSVLLGNGDGTFGAVVVYAVGNIPQAVVMADFNGDGNPDLATANYGQNTVSVLPGNGDGTFGGPVAYRMGSGPQGLVAGDVNNDGYLDLAVANFAGSTVSILLGGNRVEWLTESPAGSGMRSGQGRGTLMSQVDTDYWSFFAQAGDWMTLAAEMPNSPSSYLQYIVYGPDGSAVTDFLSQAGETPPVKLSMGGTYKVKVVAYYNYNNRITSYFHDEYRLRVTTATPPTQIEQEANNSVKTPNPALTYTDLQGMRTFSVAGCIRAADTNGDYFPLGTLTAQTEIQLNWSRPLNSELITTMGIYNASTTLMASAAAGVTNLKWTVNADTTYFARVSASSGAGLLGQYLLAVELGDVQPPTVLSTSLPAEGSTTNTVMVESFTVNYSEAMDMASVTNPANYDLRSAGDDGVLGTADDEVYGMTVSYPGALTATYTLTGLARLEGRYRFTIQTEVMDRASNPLSAPYVRMFTMCGVIGDVEGFVREGRKNDTNTLATSLSVAPLETATTGGGFQYADALAVSTNPWGVALGQFNAGANLDLVAANYTAHSVSVRLGNGDGTFGGGTDYAVGRNPVGVAVGDVNADGWRDVVTANSGATNVSVLLGNGNGTFAPAVNYAMGLAPYDVALGDFNGDGKPDLVTANYGTNFVSVRLGLGDGTFGAATNFGVGRNPIGVAVGDVNADGWRDVVVANYNTTNVSVLLGDGNGSFATAVNYMVGKLPRAVKLGDVNGDKKPDLVVANEGSNSVSVLLGDGNGTFAPGENYALGTAPYALVLVDFTGDGWLDVATANRTLNTVSVLPGNGDGTFGSAASYGVGTNPQGLAAGDVNNDGWLDLAVANYGANTVSMLLGSRVEWLTESPVGSGMRSGQGRGNLMSRADQDYWSFYGQAGDTMILAVELPGVSGGRTLTYTVYRPDGAALVNLPTIASGRTAPMVLPMSGRYAVQVSLYTGNGWLYEHQDEYRVRVTTVTPPVQMEKEANNSQATANPLTFVDTNGVKTASVGGYVEAASDLDYYNIGVVSNGTAVLLMSRLPETSQLKPVVTLYNAAGLSMAEQTGGDEADGVSEVWITQTGTYYALARGRDGTGGLMNQYLLDVVTLPVGSMNIPNLQVKRVDPPTVTDAMSGHPVSFSWVVENVRPNGTDVSFWKDRVVMSRNRSYGDSDDLLLGVFDRNGALAGNTKYTNSQTATVPAGAGGDYYVIVHTDSDNQVNELVLEGDNVGVSTNTFPVTLLPYPDLKVEGLKMTPSDPETGLFTVSWRTVNRGTLAVTNGFVDRLLVRQQDDTTILDEVYVLTAPMAVGEERSHSVTVTAVVSGIHVAQVTTDSQLEVYEFDGFSHAQAEQNTVSVSEDMIRLYVGTVVALPATLIATTQFNANWNSALRTTNYLLDVATDIGFTNFVAGYHDRSVGKVQTYAVPGLAANTTYYYRLRAQNAGGVSDHSNVILLTTLVNFPEIRVVGNGLDIANGNATPTLADHTDFGSCVWESGSSLLRTYTIRNIGAAALSVGTVSLLDNPSGDFSVVVQPSSSIVPGGSANCQVRFTPSTIALRTATLTFSNNDADENPFTFVIRGWGTPTPNVHITDLLASSVAGVATVTVATTEGAAYGLYGTDHLVPGESATWTALTSAHVGDGNAQQRPDLTATATACRFYQVALSGQTPAASNIWGLIRKDAAPGYTMISPPVRTDRRFDGELGCMLAEELQGSDGEIGMEADEIYVLQTGGAWRTLYLNAAGVWQEANGTASTYELPPGQGFWVARKAGIPACITFTGPVGNDGTGRQTLQPGFNLIGLSEGKDLPIKATFQSANPQGGSIEESADQLVFQNPDGSWRRLMYVAGWGAPFDGNWFDLGTFQIVPTNAVLEPGAAYYYLRRGGTTTVTY